MPVGPEIFERLREPILGNTLRIIDGKLKDCARNNQLIGESVDIILPDNLNMTERKEVVRLYVDAGWSKVECKTWADTQLRSGTIMFTFWK